MKRIWRVKEQNKAAQDALSRSMNISNIAAQLLINRGIDDPEKARSFLTSPLSSTHDPYLLKDMDRAMDRIKHAIRSREKIQVFGDYDVDGVTGTALLTIFLKAIGADVTPYIPHRVDEGYGLNMPAIKKAKEDGVGLIITVDCGISAFDEISYAAKCGIDIVITDHHAIVGGRLPGAAAVINPHREDSEYPFKYLAGVGVAYKLVKALAIDTDFDADGLLDLVCLGTVADIVPLTGENRIFVKHGLKKLSARGRAGLRALADVSGLGEKEITAAHIGFMLAPRINAMGRIGSSLKSLELMLTDDNSEAVTIARMLDEENRNRQQKEAAILEDALAKVEREINFSKHKVIVLASDNWHPGVVGIVASRIVERFYRPTILIALNGDHGKGSGRSIDGFHLFDHLTKASDCIEEFGGHELACGLSIKRDKIDEFRDRINMSAGGILSEDLFSPKMSIDMDIPLSSLSEVLIDELGSFLPFGAKNPRPVFSSTGLNVKSAPRRIAKGGFKMLVSDRETTVEAVSFGRGGLTAPSLGDKIDVAYVPSINSWQGINSIQLEIRDIR